MSDANDKDRVFVARSAVVLFIAGPLVPIFMLAVCGPESPCRESSGCFILFGVIAWVLAGSLWGYGASGKPDDGFIAKCALVLFIGGLLVPILIIPWKDGRDFDEATPYLLALLVTTEVLALLLGINGRRHLSGRIGMFGAMILLALALIPVALSCCMQMFQTPDQPIEIPRGP